MRLSICFIVKFLLMRVMAWKTRCSRTVMNPNRSSLWCTRADDVKKSPSVGFPLNCMAPLKLRLRSEIHSIRVVLPAPEGPMMAVNSPL
jgi:hypothetical protein